MENNQQKYTNVITEFLKSHPLISLNALEKTLDIPQSTLHKAVNSARLIPSKHIFPLLCELAGYGLEIDGFRLSVDESNNIFARKDVETVDSTDDYYLSKQYRWFAGSYLDLH